VASSFDLVVAAVQLSGIDSLIKAMRAVDARGRHFGCERCCHEEPPAVTQSPTNPAARFEPREVIHPTPRYEPRRVIHPRPRIEPCNPHRCCVSPLVVTKPPEELPLQPPWKTVPWEIPPQPVKVIKLACYRPDTTAKGTLLDSFI
jgi:hypothetical protein